MENSETPTEAENEVVENVEQAVPEEKEQEMVPLKSLQKERRKRQDSESRNQLLAEQNKQLIKARSPEPEADSSRYETATKGDLETSYNESKIDIIRTVREEDWKKANPQKAILVDEKLDELLKEKPHLAYAISNTTNRYEEAWDQLKGHGKVEEKRKPEPVKKVQAPGSPANLPRSAGISQTVDVMDMSDKDFNEWRRKQIRRR